MTEKETMTMKDTFVPQTRDPNAPVTGQVARPWSPMAHRMAEAIRQAHEGAAAAHAHSEAIRRPTPVRVDA